MSRHRFRTAALVVGVLVLLPAAAAHAALPLDPTARSSGTAASPSSSTADQDDVADDDSDDSATQDASDDSFDDADDSDSTAADDATDDSDSDSSDDSVSGSGSGGAKARSGSSSSRKAGGTSSTRSGGSSTRSGSSVKALTAPRGVRARLAAFDRVVVSWKPGSSVKLTRWVVTLRSGGTGRLLYLGRLARSATFTALKPGVRYSATVTATASGGRNASASTAIRTLSLKKAVREVAREQARVDRAVRLAKVQRFG